MDSFPKGYVLIQVSAVSMMLKYNPRAGRKPFGIGLQLGGTPLFTFEKRLVGKQRPYI
jgi:hypothetical protein